MTTEKIKKRRIRGGKENDGLTKNSSQNVKKIDILPNYLSPYTKKLVESDIPLKTLIERTNNYNYKKKVSNKLDRDGVPLNNKTIAENYDTASRSRSNRI